MRPGEFEERWERLTAAARQAPQPAPDQVPRRFARLPRREPGGTRRRLVLVGAACVALYAVALPLVGPALSAAPSAPVALPRPPALPPAPLTHPPKLVRPPALPSPSAVWRKLEALTLTDTEVP